MLLSIRHWDPHGLTSPHGVEQPQPALQLLHALSHVNNAVLCGRCHNRLTHRANETTHPCDVIAKSPVHIVLVAPAHNDHAVIRLGRPDGPTNRLPPVLYHIPAVPVAHSELLLRGPNAEILGRDSTRGGDNRAMKLSLRAFNACRRLSAFVELWQKP